MKKILLVAAATASMLSMNAEPVTINHVTSGELATELQAAIDADPDDALTALSDITELTIVGEAAMVKADFTAITDNFKTTLTYLDLSQAVFTDNKIPGGAYDASGVLTGMTALVTVKIPDTIVLIPGACFKGCTNLEHVNLPEGITTIWDYTFRDCKKINFEKLPENIKIFRPYCFYNCTSLTLKDLPPLTREVYEYAFWSAPVQFSELPATVELLKELSFFNTKVTFSSMPEKVTSIGKECFNQSNVSFTSLPDGIKTIGEKAFRNTKVKLSTFPASLTSLGAAVFCNISPDEFPEFTINNVAGLWDNIPNQTFYVGDGSTPRSFICRSPNPPTAAVDATGYTGVFGQADVFPKITFKVLASSMEKYEETAPYSSMNLVALTTPVQAPMIDIDGGDASKCIVTLTVAGKDHQDFTEEVYEGEGDFTFEVASVASNNEAFYIERISYLEPEVYAEGDETEEPVDDNLLYAATGDIKDLVDQPATVHVNVAPGMKQLYVKVSNAYYFLTGVEAVDAPANTVRRVGDTVYTTLPGAQLYDLAGRMVARTASNTIDLSGLPAGTYILRAGNTTMKILK